MPVPLSGKPSSSSLSRLYPWLLVVVGAATYGGALDGPLIYDDINAIVNNPHIQGWSTFWLAPPDRATEGRPVISLSLAANYAVGGVDVRGYHALNIAVHILCALVLYGIVRRTLRLETLASQFGQAADGIALASALLWMVHPLASEPVNYIIQRTESIMALFYLFTLYCAIRAIDAPRRGAWMAASVASCALGMGSKEVMVTAPFVVLVYDLVFHPGPMGQTMRVRAPLYVGLAATWGVLAALMCYFPHQGTVGFSHGVSAWEYAKNQCPVLVRYLQLAVWPDRLTIDYGYPQTLSLGEVAWYGAVVVGLIAVTIVALIRWPMLGFLGAWFFIILSPTSSFIPLRTEVGADRRMYLPLAALVVLVVIAAYTMLDTVLPNISWRGKKMASGEDKRWVAWLGAALAATGAAILIFATLDRNRDYRSEVAIWQSAVEAQPTNHRASNNLGLAYENQGERDTAKKYYERAIELDSEYALAHNNLGVVLQAEGRYEAAAKHFRKASDVAPKYATVWLNLGRALESQGRRSDAIGYYRLALRLAPDLAKAHNHLAIALEKQGRSAAALRHYRDAVKIKPDFVDAHSNLAAALYRRGELDDSIHHYRQALELRPDFAEAHTGLGICLLSTGQINEAIEHLRTAVRLKPNYAQAQENLKRAKTMLGSGNPPRSSIAPSRKGD